jgi:4-amino-4-deoxy-L-arabinose transferase-like glycosyltransferase
LNRIAPEDGASRRRTFLAFLFVALSGAAQLAGTPHLNPDEGRYLEVAREMIATGDYVVPRIDGHEHWTKPPGAYWAIAASLRAFDLAPWSARLPAYLAALATAAALFALVRRCAGSCAAACAVVVHASMLEPFALFRMATPDSLQAAAIAVALAASFAAREEERDGASARARRLRFGAYAALGVAFVIKGPIGLLVYAAVGAADAIGARRLPPWRLVLGRGAAALGVTLAIGLPWFLVVAARKPELVDYYLRNEVAGRYFTDVHGRTQPFWFFVPVVLGGLLPWTGPALYALAAAIRARGPFAASDAPDAATAVARDRDRVRYLAAWFCGTFVMFSLGRSKLVTYVLPLFPAAAALIALAFVRGVGSPALRRLLTATAASTALVGGTVAGFILVRGASGGVDVAVLIGASLVLAAFAALLVRRLRPSSALFALAIAASAAQHGSLFTAMRREDALGIHGDLGWVADELQARGLHASGVPLGVHALAHRPEPHEISFAFFGAAVHTLELRLLGATPEYFPHLVADETFAEQSRAKGEIDVAAFVAAAGAERPAYIVTRGRLVEELEKKAGRKLIEVARRGVERQAVVLLKTP